MNEQYYDALLRIHTIGEQKGFHQSLHYHRYEPTPYAALEELFNQYEMRSSDRVVDFGCGKGRLNFYLHHRFQATVVGVEMDEAFHQEAVENLNRYSKKHKYSKDKISFFLGLAEEYHIHPGDNHFYFFNPFSLPIFIRVINNIMQSVAEEARAVDVILYFPTEDYIYYLQKQTTFELVHEVKLTGMYGNNPNERFLIFRMEG
jgi:SAM-dependent methyltransferase